MTRPRLNEIRSIEELRAAAPAWDDLWRRSQIASPMARAEMHALWLERFAPDSTFRALVVERDGQLVAALPIVGARLRGLVEVGRLPTNPWSGNGEVLIDPSETTNEELDLLSDGLSRLPWSLLWFEGLPWESPRWQRMLAAFDRAGMDREFHPAFQVGITDLSADWTNYEAGLSKNLRKSLRKSRNKLEQSGSLSLVARDDLPIPAVEGTLRRAFEIEDRSWKRLTGTSIIQAGMFEFFLRQARQLAEWRQLSVSFLEQSGHPLAFEYGYRSNGVYFSHKVGYDETYARFGPGQLITQMLLQRFHERAEVGAVDYVGPLSDATARWTTRSYTLGRLVVSPRTLWGQLLLGAYRSCAPYVRRFRERAISNDSDGSSGD